MFSPNAIAGIAAVAAERNLEAAALLAVAEVESGGVCSTRVDGRDEPLIRFEGHYFDRRLSAGKRAVARAAELSSPVAGQVPNPPSQSARWRLLARAKAIDVDAALESVSWGLGQVMGAHWSGLGYADVGALVAEARAGVRGQACLMARFIEWAGLQPCLHRHDWAAFARGYNGPAYSSSGYDRKLALAYRRHSDRLRASALSHP
jgi:N-acetylmuramidase